MIVLHDPTYNYKARMDPQWPARRIIAEWKCGKAMLEIGPNWEVISSTNGAAPAKLIRWLKAHEAYLEMMGEAHYPSQASTIS